VQDNHPRAELCRFNAAHFSANILFEFRKFQQQTALRGGAKESRGAPIQKPRSSAKN